MFAIYNINGCRFRDSLENLRKVHKTQTSPRSQFESNIANDETQVVLGTGMTDIGSTEKEIFDTGMTAAKSTALPRAAQQAYKDTQQLNQREPIQYAHQLMSTPVSTVQMDMDILTARQLLKQQGFQQMPVLDQKNRLVGMLSIENLLHFIIIDGDQMQYLRGKRVQDAMSSEVITSDPTSDIRRVARVMREHRLQSLPVVDKQDNLIGIVSRSDILRAVTNEQPLNMWS